MVLCRACCGRSAGTSQWIDRVKKGKPIIVCGDGFAIHQHLHVDDIAKAFVGVIGKEHTIGQTYNAVNRGYITWADYHRLAGEILGKEVELVGVPFEDLKKLNVPDFGILEDNLPIMPITPQKGYSAMCLNSIRRSPWSRAWLKFLKSWNAKEEFPIQMNCIGKMK